MKVIDSILAMREQSRQWRSRQLRIGFVATMGNLHAGHLSLVKLAAEDCDRVVVSIYVNPLQFAPGEDFASYPRTLEQDLDQLATSGVDAVFTPDDAMMYPGDRELASYVDVPALANILEGEFRPGFFRGVATVVNKLFNIVQPDLAVFGEKDYQQLLVLRRMVSDLDMPVEIMPSETMREQGGLAMSSRNSYLDPGQREQASLLYASMNDFVQSLRKAHRNADGSLVAELEASAINSLEQAGFSVDYFTLRFADDLGLPEKLDADTGLIVLLAARLGTTRLIDNYRFSL